MKLKNIFSLFTISLLIVACSQNPFTGKKTLALIPNSQIFPMALQQYKQFLSENKVVKNTPEANKVTNIGQKIAVAAERYLNAVGYPGYLKDYKWEYNLVDDPAVNAWVMPGGKVVVYTGILPVTQTDAALAAVMGHEVAHALANHGQQRMSAAQLQMLGAVAGNVAFSKDPKKQKVFNDAYGIGSTVGVMLPFSRKHESEADRIGLTLMAIAGYDPVEAGNLWVRMSQQGGQKPPEILSTHPSDETRINNIKKWIPEAKAEARKFGVTKFIRN